LDFSLPLQGAKGYGLTAERPSLAPQHALYLTEARVGVSPFDHAVRLAGTLELGSADLRLNSRRIGALRRAAALYLNPEALITTGKPWTGLRPLLPDGLPAIGPVPGWKSAFLATGHGLLGITLAPVTGELIADVVESGRLPARLTALDPRRFEGRRSARKEAQSKRRQTSPRGLRSRWPTIRR
jgi:D-amino-acid dehydrogenase